ncbi:MAG: homocysteine S-methyltransferase family protein [Desulfobacterales bacterium]|nr:homocysteine S-methyltransferase family protein [Desulfobacterales bacterium]
MDILEKVKKDGLLFDGGMGSMLIKAGLTGGKASEIWNLEKPDVIKDIHQAYYDAGADVATTNTFGASSVKLERMGVTEDIGALNRAAVKIARKAAGEGKYVAGDIGPLGEMLQPSGTISVEQAIDSFTEQAGYLEETGVDLFIVETIFDINEALAAIKGIQSVSQKPIFCTLTFQQMENGFFTIMGNNPADSMKQLADAGASAVGANCSIASNTMIDLARELKACIDIPVITQPNAGMPETGEGDIVSYPENEDFFSNSIKEIKALGVEIVGGCCGTTPKYIKRVKEII